MLTIKKINDQLDRVLILCAVLTLVGMMLLIMSSVVGRYVFNQPIPDDVVITELSMTLLVFLPLSAVQAAREHVFVTIFTEWMSNKSKVIMETIGTFVGLGIFLVFSFATFGDFMDAYVSGAYMEGDFEVPEAPARFAVFFGIAVFSFRLFLDSIGSIIGLFDGTATATQSEEERILHTDI